MYLTIWMYLKKKQVKVKVTIKKLGNLILDKLKGVLQFGYRLRKDDPVYSCPTYTTKGCPHVDGFLCHFPICNTDEFKPAKIYFHPDFTIIEINSAYDFMFGEGEGWITCSNELTSIGVIFWLLAHNFTHYGLPVKIDRVSINGQPFNDIELRIIDIKTI